MVTLAQLTARFPEYQDLTQPRFDIFLADSVLEMGEDAGRWISEDFYNKAQAYLLAHVLTLAGAQELGDSNPNAPLKKTEVDDVVVEFDTPQRMKQELVDTLQSTSYGQEYYRLRRMAFGGAHMAYNPIMPYN